MQIFTVSAFLHGTSSNSEGEMFIPRTQIRAFFIVLGGRQTNKEQE